MTSQPPFRRGAILGVSAFPLHLVNAKVASSIALCGPVVEEHHPKGDP